MRRFWRRCRSAAFGLALAGVVASHPGHGLAQPKPKDAQGKPAPGFVMPKSAPASASAPSKTAPGLATDVSGATIYRHAKIPFFNSFRRIFMVTVNGDAEERHRKNVDVSFEAMAEIGARKQDIWTVGGGIAVKERLPGTSEGLKLAFRIISQNADSRDLVVLYVTGHGQRDKSGSRLVLKDGEMPEKDFIKIVKQAEKSTLMAVFDGCFSGGLANAIVDADMNSITMSPETEDKETSCQGFAPPFWAAVKNGVDLNGNGVGSLYEAFQFALDFYNKGSHRNVRGTFRKSIPSIDSVAELEGVLKSGRPALIEFSATWCGPCKEFARTLNIFQSAYGEEVDVYKIDVDGKEAAELKKRLKFPEGEGIPTTMAVSGGAVVQTFTGSVPLEQVAKVAQEKFGIVRDPAAMAKQQKSMFLSLAVGKSAKDRAFALRLLKPEWVKEKPVLEALKDIVNEKDEAALVEMLPNMRWLPDEVFGRKNGAFHRLAALSRSQNKKIRNAARDALASGGIPEDDRALLSSLRRIALEDLGSDEDNVARRGAQFTINSWNSVSKVPAEREQMLRKLAERAAASKDRAANHVFWAISMIADPSMKVIVEKEITSPRSLDTQGRAITAELSLAKKGVSGNLEHMLPSVYSYIRQRGYGAEAEAFQLAAMASRTSGRQLPGDILNLLVASAVMNGRSYHAQPLCEMGHPVAIPIMESDFQATDYARVEAVSCLLAFAVKNPALLRHRVAAWVKAVDGKNTVENDNILKALALIREPESIPLLAPLLSSEIDLVRNRAMEAIYFTAMDSDYGELLASRHAEKIEKFARTESPNTAVKKTGMMAKALLARMESSSLRTLYGFIRFFDYIFGKAK